MKTISKNHIYMGLGLFVVIGLYRASQMLGKAYSATDKAVDSVVDPLADAYFQWANSDYVEPSEFRVNRLNVEMFGDNWVMNEDAFTIYSQAYPKEMKMIFDGRTLKEKYRSEVSL